jgi:uncharacterized lipoprotein NlpE involved in copper resistance
MKNIKKIILAVSLATLSLMAADNKAELKKDMAAQESGHGKHSKSASL